VTNTGELDSTQQALVNLVIRGMLRGAPDTATASLVEQGYALNKGPITMPTQAGTAAAGDIMRLPADSEDRREVDAVFDRFLPVNRQLREVCSAWQAHPDGTPNDHTDPEYDHVVRQRLDDVHASIGPVLDRLTELVPRLAGYAPRLQEALDRFGAGESSWLASPLCDSFHTVWMHLHQEFLLMLGLTRAEDEAREERLVGSVAS
jgi:hypothetical protein